MSSSKLKRLVFDVTPAYVMINKWNNLLDRS